MNRLQRTPEAWKSLFSRRILGAKTSFIREILKVTADPEIISFAGGLPSPELFPIEAIARASAEVLRNDGRSALQYTTTEGFLPLREWIVARYARRFGLKVSTDEILITTGSQQALDLLGKAFLNPGDRLLIERPGYLGAIQSFSLCEPRFVGVNSGASGIDLAHLEEEASRAPAKLLYSVPNFQNPSGASYSLEAREKIAELSMQHGFAVIEDDPYGELRYRGQELPSLRSYTPDAILLGSFSKVVAPGFRIGWVCAPRDLIKKLIIAKQASDLHSDIFAQRVLSNYLHNNDLDQHLLAIRASYGVRARTMVKAFREFMPSSARCNDPEGGMFLWAEIPDGQNSLALFDKAIARKVAFVPGSAFYCDQGGENTMRLNFTNTPEPLIVEGIRRLSSALVVC